MLVMSPKIERLSHCQKDNHKNIRPQFSLNIVEHFIIEDGFWGGSLSPEGQKKGRDNILGFDEQLISQPSGDGKEWLRLDYQIISRAV